LLKPALDALLEQYEITGQSEARNSFHHREIGKTEQQNLRFVFHRQDIRQKKAVTSPRTRLPMDGKALNFQIS
jgi:integrase